MHSLRMDWELNGTETSLNSYINAAKSLATRYDERVRAIRSWDKAVSHSYEIVDKEKNFLIIIDSMCSRQQISNPFSEPQELTDTLQTWTFSFMLLTTPPIPSSVPSLRRTPIPFFVLSSVPTIRHITLPILTHKLEMSSST